MIPKFEAYYRNLHPSFLVFDKFLLFLKNEYLNGFVLLEGSGKKAYLFMFEGETQACLVTSDSSRYKKITPVDFSALLTPDTVVSTFRCRHEHVEFFTKAHTAKMVYNNLSSDIINPSKLIQRCCTDDFTGYIEADTGRAGTKMYIYFYKGNILGTMNIGKKEGVFEPPLDDAVIQEKISNTSINLFKLSQDTRNPEKDHAQLVRCFEEIFNMLEDRSGNRDFASIWRKCALDLSDKFVFLDPFAGEFSYAYRKIDIWEKINIKTAVHGMNELVNLIAKRMAVPESEIASIKNNYLGILADYEIRN